MTEHDTHSIQATVNFYPRFGGKDKTHFLESKDKLRVSLLFYRQNVAAILQSEPKPTATQNSPAVVAWTRANENLFSILFFTTERSANNVVKKHMGKTREDGVGNGQVAWNALEKKYWYNSPTKEASRAYHEHLHSTKMKSGDDPDVFLYTMDGCRERREDMGQQVPNERYEDIILQTFPAEYERACTASYERRDSHLADIRRMMSALYIDCLSRLNNSPLVVVRGVAMHLTGGGDSPVNCHYCSNLGRKGMKRGKRKPIFARSTSLSLTATRHAARNNIKWAAMGAPIAPARSRTNLPSSLQAILLPGVILRSEVYRSLQ